MRKKKVVAFLWLEKTVQLFSFFGLGYYVLLVNNKIQQTSEDFLERRVIPLINNEKQIDTG